VRVLASRPLDEETPAVSTEALALPAPEGTPGLTALGRLRAARRTFVVLAEVLDVPVVASGVRAVTRRPRRESIEIGDVPAELVIPAGRGPWPACVFVTGAHPLRRRERVVHRLAEGLGRAGFLVLVPDLPGLGEGEVSEQTLERAIRVAHWTVRREDVNDGQVLLCGASVGAGLALVVAAQPELTGSIAVVSAVCPFANLEKIVCLATTRRYGDDGKLDAYDAAILLRRVVARSLLATLPEGSERAALLAHAGDVLHDEEDPIEPLRAVDLERLEPDARAIVRLLTNLDSDRFGELYDALPADARALSGRLSPLPRAASVRARVELIVPPLDPYFPPGEIETLAAAFPASRLTVSGMLDHTRPGLSLARVGQLARFTGFVLRSLAVS